jgi:hypothetical protein
VSEVWAIGKHIVVVVRLGVVGTVAVGIVVPVDVGGTNVVPGSNAVDGTVPALCDGTNVGRESDGESARNWLEVMNLPAGMRLGSGATKLIAGWPASAASVKTCQMVAG